MKPLLTFLYLLSPTLATTSGTFTILTFNIAGIPDSLSSTDIPGNKTSNTQIIGERFTEYGYDVIHVQEDFNYHDALYSATTDAYPHRTTTSGEVPFGSGLNTLSTYDWIGFERVEWETCSNVSDGGRGLDCLVPKGFTVMRVRFSDGVYVDFYNLHADAGSQDADVSARSANLQQVADYIAINSAGNAVLVFGDTNARYTSEGENIRVFDTQEGMTDPWVELVLDGQEPEEGGDAAVCENPTRTERCEAVDKIFYRGSPALILQATSWGYEDDKFLNNGSILSDHSPISSEFNWTKSDSFRLSDLYGGSHGTWFNDLPNLSPSPSGLKTTTISVSGGSRLDSIALTLCNGDTTTHGGPGGIAQELTLADDEYWTTTRLCQGEVNGHARIFYIAVKTDLGNTVHVGRETDDCVEYEAEEGWGVIGTWGRSGDEIDMLGVVYGLTA